MSRTDRVDKYALFGDETTFEFEVESAALLRHSRDIESRDMAGVNLRAFPIASAGAVTEKPRTSGQLNPEQRNANGMPHDVDRARPLDPDDNDVALSDDDVVVIYDSEMELLNPNRHHDVFQDPMQKANWSELKTLKRRAICSLILIGIVSTLSGVGFLPYYADVFLLNVDDVRSQQICYLIVVTLSVVSTALAHVTMNVIGYKWSMFIGCLGISAFTAARFFSWTAFYITSSVICGLTSGPLTMTIVTCTLDVARDYAAMTGIDVTVIVCYFDAFLNFCLLISPALSALLRLAFLSSESHESFQNDERHLDCFRDFCWTDSLGIAIYEVSGFNNRTASQWFMVQGLLGSFFGCSLGGALLIWIEAKYLSGYCDQSGSEVWITVSDPDPDSRSRMTCSADCWSSGSCSLLLKETTAMLCRNLTLLLLLLWIYLGVEQYFIYSIFLQTYGQCSAQMFQSLMLAINLSLTAAFCSMPTAPFIAHFGRFKILVPAVLTQLALMVALLASKQLGIASQHVIAAFWGAADGVLHNGLIVIVFEAFGERTNVALVCLKSCQLVGYLIMVTLQLIGLPNYAILIFAISLLLLALLCYCILEIRIRVDKQDSATRTSQYVPLLNEASWIPHVSPVLVRRDKRQPLSSKIRAFSYDS